MSATPATGTPASAWLERAARLTPGGVHSPVRAFRAVGLPPLAIAEAHGARLRDAAGQEYVDWIGAWGPALLGHAPAGVVRAVQEAASRGLLFGLASLPEAELAEKVTGRVPGAEMVRFVVTGTEATMSAVRLARAATGRAGLVKFEGAYHGHGDAFLVKAGSGAATFGVPDSPGVTAGAVGDTRVARFNDLGDVERCLLEPSVAAAVIVEPVMGNMGCVPPEPGFLQGLRELCDRHGALLIMDEVMTGFRVARGGASERYGVKGDLQVLGKVLGGGMPLAAFAGRRDLMSRVSPAGPVYQAGTFAAHPLAIAAGLATFEAIDADPGFYARLEDAGARLERGLAEAARAAGCPAQVQRVGSMWTVFFSGTPVRSWDDAAAVDRAAHAAFFRGMLERGVLLPPSPFESAFLSAAHGEEEIERTLAAARAAFAEAAAR